eukprot:TRINITY_DN103659_c0_g1_i1.p1 TRINITY_DN103659_c0_g1~~TRINITY_DN103659_c0_g1_i1.p1  ORF type:complete len:269 (-),score=51.68 TRINITY_DN103659_c0_g1_i1:390-1196(-)
MASSKEPRPAAALDLAPGGTPPEEEKPMTRAPSKEHLSMLIVRKAVRSASTRLSSMSSLGSLGGASTSASTGSLASVEGSSDGEDSVQGRYRTPGPSYTSTAELLKPPSDSHELAAAAAATAASRPLELSLDANADKQEVSPSTTEGLPASDEEAEEESEEQEGLGELRDELPGRRRWPSHVPAFRPTVFQPLFDIREATCEDLPSMSMASFMGHGTDPGENFTCTLSDSGENSMEWSSSAEQWLADFPDLCHLAGHDVSHLDTGRRP